MSKLNFSNSQQVFPDASRLSSEHGEGVNAEAKHADDSAQDELIASIQMAQIMANAMMRDLLTMMIRNAMADLVEQLVAEPDSETPDMTTEFDSESMLETELDYPDSLHQGRSRWLH